jgi:hypothetical protein
MNSWNFMKFGFDRELAKNIERVSEREKKTLARLLSGFEFLLAKPDFYSHLASWRVVILTPDFSCSRCRRQP